MLNIEKIIEAFDEEKTLVWNDDDYYDIGYNSGLEAGKNIAIALWKEQNKEPLRCKECSYHRKDGWCMENDREVKESDYCSLGAWESE